VVRGAEEKNVNRDGSCAIGRVEDRVGFGRLWLGKAATDAMIIARQSDRQLAPMDWLFRLLS